MENFPPRRDAAGTRDRILEAGKRLFSHQPFENVGVRTIADQAGIDPALIPRYFGSKLGLYTYIAENLAFSADFVDASRGLSGGQIAEFLFADRSGAFPTDFDAVLFLMMGASSQETAPLVARCFHDNFVVPLAGRLNADQAEYRAALLSSMILGFSIFRFLLREPSLEIGHEDERTLLTRVFGGMLGDESR